MAVSFPQLHIHYRLLLISQTLISVPRRAIPNPFPLPPIPRRSFHPIRTFQVGVATPSEEESKLPTAGLEEDLMGFVMGKRKVTDVAHSVWKNVVQRGDVVVDATCGNGYDTLALLKMVADQSKEGIVYAIDIQKSALESTSSLLGQSAGKEERERVKLFHLCHSDMENVVPKGTSVRVVVFNLGYLPGGDKAIITVPNTTLLALEAASRIVGPGGLISVLVYVGHPGGRDELEIVQSFAPSLPADSWVSSKYEVLNRPAAPMLVLMF